MVDYEKKSSFIDLEVKSEEDGILTVEGYGCVFGNIDSYDDIIVPGACDKFLASDEAERLAICWQHDKTEVIGKLVEKSVDDKGFKVVFEILPTSKGKDVAVLVKSGAVRELSIGYRAKKYHYEQVQKRQVRYLDEITITEVSLVTRAANPKAKVVSTKEEGSADPFNNSNNSNINTMTPEEIKSMQESIETQVLKQTSEEMKALKAEIEKKNGTIADQAKSIDNLDATAKEQQKSIDELKARFKEKVEESFKSALANVLEENKSRIEDLVKGEKAVLEFKTDTGLATANINSQSLSVQHIPGVSAAPTLPNAVLGNLMSDTRSGHVVSWTEGTKTNNVGYVDELGLSNESVYAAAEKQRKYAKIGTRILISAEVADWFDEIARWAQSEGIAAILAKVDELLMSGDGADSTTPKHVYGLKGESTAFAKAGTYTNATVADVLKDAILQITKNGFAASMAFMSYEGENALRTIKDANGNYIYDSANRMLGQLRIIPTNKLGAKEAIVLDGSCARVYSNGGFELEVERKADVDGYMVYLRTHVQKVTSTAQKKGIIYVSDYTTAITAISA